MKDNRDVDSRNLMISLKMDQDPESSSRNRKFGLPSWMLNNIERLNFATDFEQYACSPPETEGFLSEHVDNSDFHDTSEPYCPVVIPSDPGDEKLPKDPMLSLDIQEELRAPCPLVNSPEPLSPTLSPILSSLKHEEFYSSPDSTPCATPEPSPAPRRRMSGQQDSVQHNPGRWFYLGNPKKEHVKGPNVANNKENRRKSSDKSNESPHKIKDPSAKPKKNAIKLVISNFDINAISPSSW